MTQPSLGMRIAELRNKKGITQKELADACNVDIRTIQRIESGHVVPRMYTIRLLATALNTDIGFLVIALMSTHHRKKQRTINN